MSKAMTGIEFANLCRRLFGSAKWVKHTADWLCVDRSTLHRWARGAGDVPIMAREVILYAVRSKYLTGEGPVELGAKRYRGEGWQLTRKRVNEKA